MGDVYYDSEDRECDLAVMCLREPAWACSRIGALTAEVAALRDALAASTERDRLRERELNQAVYDMDRAKRDRDRAEKRLTDMESATERGKEG